MKNIPRQHHRHHHHHHIDDSFSIVDAVAVAASGAMVDVPNGTFAQTCKINQPITLHGRGIGKTIINASGIEPIENKSILLPAVPGVTITGFTLEGASISSSLGSNAAGVRDDGNSIGFILTDSEITGCQDGILTFQSDIVVDGCHFHGNGNNDGLTHNMYVTGTPATTFDCSNTLTEDALGGHYIKSRAGRTNLTNVTVLYNSANGGHVDFPDGGTVDAVECLFDQSSATDGSDRNFVTYGEESSNNGAQTVTFTNCVFKTPAGLGTYITSSIGGTLVLNGCTWQGSGPAPSISGWASVQGTLTAE